MRRIRQSVLTALLLLLGFGLVYHPQAAQAHANYDHSEPAANATVPSGQSPAQVQVWFTEQVEPNFSTLAVLDQNGKHVEVGGAKPVANDPNSLTVGLQPNLPDGPYTVSFKSVSAEDGHIVTSSFAFLVGAGTLPAGVLGVSPLDLAEQSQTGPTTNLNFWSVLLRWLNYLSAAALVGALVYALLVWRPAVAQARATKRMGTELDKAYRLGLGRAGFVSGLGMLGLLVGWLGWILYQAASFSNQSFGQLFGFGDGTGLSALSDFLFNSHYGQIWLARFVLLVLTGLALWLTFSGGSRRPLPAIAKPITPSLLPSEDVQAAVSSPAPVAANTVVLSGLDARPKLAWLTLGLGALTLMTSSLSSHAAGVPNWTWFLIGSDWVHLLSTSVWIGGLLAMSSGLAAAIPALRPGSGDRTRLLAALIPAFSQLAIISVMLLIITGTLQATVHLSDPGDLILTPYGLSLTVKISLMVPLLLLGAYNLLVVSPKMRRWAKSKKTGAEGAGSLEAGKQGLRFRQAVIAEIVLALLVLVAAAFLTSTAPPSGVTDHLVSMQSIEDDLTVDFALTPAQPGSNTFEVRLSDTVTGEPATGVRSVQLQLSMIEMDMGNSQLDLKPTGANNGRYIGQAAFVSMSGTWHGQLVIQRDGHADIKMPVSFKTANP